MATTGKDREFSELDNTIAEYRMAVVTAGYERLLKLMGGGVYEDWEAACKIGHMLKEMGLV